MEPESAETAESACRLFTSPAWGASTVGPTSAVDGWNGPNSGWRSGLSLVRCRRARGWWAVEVDGTSAGGGGSGWLVADGGSGAGSGVGVWARAQAQTSSAMTTTPIANPTLTADPGCTILRRGLACWLDSTSATAPRRDWAKPARLPCGVPLSRRARASPIPPRASQCGSGTTQPQRDHGGLHEGPSWVDSIGSSSRRRAQAFRAGSRSRFGGMAASRGERQSSRAGKRRRSGGLLCNAKDEDGVPERISVRP
jgi:hypothetical protein